MFKGGRGVKEEVGRSVRGKSYRNALMNTCNVQL